MKKYIICAPDFNPKMGGAIALHKLCHVLNELGQQAYLFPLVDGYNISISSYEIGLLSVLNSKNRIKLLLDNLKTSSVFRTPIYPGSFFDIQNDSDLVVVYPEIIFGNPLKARNVARWLLHNPGFHKGDAYYTKGEVQFCYSDNFSPLNLPWLTLAPFNLMVTDFPYKLYFNGNDDVGEDIRNGIAYCIKKGKNRNDLGNVANGIIIDDLNHEEISSIFKKIKTFVSYDTNTMYSSLAALSGADSIIVPIDGVSHDDLIPAKEDRYGVAYGEADLQRARSTRNLLLDRMKNFEAMTIENVKKFINFWNAKN